jgi:hypothetical protein
MTGPKIDLQTAYAVVHTLHVRRRGADDDSCFTVIPDDALRTWFQSTIIDTLYERELLMEESVVLASIYVAELLTSRRGKRYRAITHADPALALRLNDIVEKVGKQDVPVHMLLLAEQAFFMFCFLPESRHNRQLAYRKYALDFGRAAYGTHAAMTDKPLGKHMEHAFEPLGEIVRTKFTPPS